MNMQNNFAATLKQIRNGLGMSMKEFSKMLEISLSSLVEYEAGRRMPRGETIEHIAGKLNISSASLIGGSPSDTQTLYSCLYHMSLEIQTLHPDTRTSAKHALNLLLLSVQASDELFYLESQGISEAVPYHFILQEQQNEGNGQ